MSSSSVAAWDPEKQIYVGGAVPNHNQEQVEEYLRSSKELRIFGYGSLCWGPGTGALAKEGVEKNLGRAIGYKRCWSQKSTDHRGTPNFPGIVCTLLSDAEVNSIHGADTESKPNMVEGIVYTIPSHQVEDCLAELDFREKGGYARDVVQVVLDGGEQVEALLYRGTPGNPAFWSRAILDLEFAAAVISVSIGPSGKNDAYLFQLDEFMASTASSIDSDYQGDTDTKQLAFFTRDNQEKQLYFMFGAGSNQHNQLLLSGEGIKLTNGEDAHELTEFFLCTEIVSDSSSSAAIKQISAGGGHSALLGDSGGLWIWGWNESKQLGRLTSAADGVASIPRLKLLAEKVALGFSHTLIVEKDTGKLYAFGSNDRGQVTNANAEPSVETPVLLFPDQSFVDIAGGLFHSAAITDDGYLVSFGCNSFGQTLGQQWKPNDGSKLVKVACGRRHTIALDDTGRIWTLGDNKYGQLGHSMSRNPLPQVVDGPLGQEGSGCVGIESGWSHCIASVKNGNVLRLCGWGRNDKGQLGLGVSGDILSPTPLSESHSVTDFSCGSESTMFVDADGRLWGTGWNEHGNLGIGTVKNTMSWSPVVGARIVAPPPSSGSDDVLIACGGAHVFAIRNS